MKIKIPFFEIESDKACPCNDFNEYQLKLKCMRTKLHGRYIACISLGIVIWLLATGQANTQEFSAWISFASTVTSIILSVIAIIMSIFGESKTDAIRDEIEETVKKLERTADVIEQANKDSIKNINSVKQEIKELKGILQKIPDKTVEKIQTSYVLDAKEINNKENSNIGWLNNGK